MGLDKTAVLDFIHLLHFFLYGIQDAIVGPGCLHHFAVHGQVLVDKQAQNAEHPGGSGFKCGADDDVVVSKIDIIPVLGVESIVYIFTCSFWIFRIPF